MFFFVAATAGLPGWLLFLIYIDPFEIFNQAKNCS